jgi:hypothetical protein
MGDGHVSDQIPGQGLPAAQAFSRTKAEVTASEGHLVGLPPKIMSRSIEGHLAWREQGERILLAAVSRSGHNDRPPCSAAL